MTNDEYCDHLIALGRCAACADALDDEPATHVVRERVGFAEFEDVRMCDFHAMSWTAPRSLGSDSGNLPRSMFVRKLENGK